MNEYPVQLNADRVLNNDAKDAVSYGDAFLGAVSTPGFPFLLV